MKHVPNSFQVSNSLVDELLPLMGNNELRCYLVIVRQTTGWQKRKDRISIAQLESKTGIKRRAIQHAMSALIDKNLIKRTTKKGQISEYELTKSSAQNDTTKPKVVHEMTLGSAQNDTRGSAQNDTLQNQLLQNQLLQKVNAAAFNEFIEYRKEIKKPVKGASLEKLQAKFARYDFATQQAAVDKSIECGWQGIFPDKIETSGATNEGWGL